MTDKRHFPIHVIPAFLIVSVVTSSAMATEQADRLLKRIGLDRGICVVLDDPDCKLAMEMAEKSKLLVYVQMPDAEHVDGARRAAEVAGLDARRLSIEQGSLSRLHLADNIADALVAGGDAGAISEAEALRVLRPGGRAFLGQRELVKPMPDGMDDWTHVYHGPDNNPVSQDRLVRAPYMTQFLADPRYGPAPQVSVAKVIDPRLDGFAVRLLDRFRKRGLKTESIQFGSPQVIVRQQFDTFELGQAVRQFRDAVQVFLSCIVAWDHWTTEKDLRTAVVQPSQICDDQRIRFARETLVQPRIGLFEIVKPQVDQWEQASHGAPECVA